jgi:hypothetical protein
MNERVKLSTNHCSKGLINSKQLVHQCMEPVKLTEMRWITEPMARTNQGPSATIMNRTRIRIKNDTTTIISNLVDNKKLQLKLRYMRNRRDIKLGSVKSVND